MSLNNHFLIATPSVMQDSIFHDSVIYITQHSATQGAIGVIINKPITNNLSDLFASIKLKENHFKLDNNFLLLGGPVKTNIGFCLQKTKKPELEDLASIYNSIFATTITHNAVKINNSNNNLLNVNSNDDVDNNINNGNIVNQEIINASSNDEYQIISNTEVISDIIASNPKLLKFAGYTSWEPYQLETEIAQNKWLVTESQKELMFDVSPDKRYFEALKLLGINNLSSFYYGRNIVT